LTLLILQDTFQKAPLRNLAETTQKHILLWVKIAAREQLKEGDASFTKYQASEDGFKDAIKILSLPDDPDSRTMSQLKTILDRQATTTPPSGLSKYIQQIFKIDAKALSARIDILNAPEACFKPGNRIS
jgi:hypothetical protein